MLALANTSTSRDTPHFLEIGSFYHSPRVKQLSVNSFRMYSADFLIFRRLSVTRQFLVSLIPYLVGKKYTMEVNKSKNCLSGYWYSSKYQKIGWIHSKTVNT